MSEHVPMDLSLRQAADWIPGGRLVGDGDIRVSRVSTDTRSIERGDLFVALVGERFDAHDFLPQLSAGGVAAAAIAQHGLVGAALNGVEVPDSRRALGDLARGWRARFTLPLIAVTGSNGKTTATQMTAGILRTARPGAVLATQGNLNNDIGVPLTLLRLHAGHRLGVVELGMNHPGEIAHLADIAQPTVALVNNAQREHQEFMGTVEAVARENGAVIQALPQDGWAVFPADDEFAGLWRGFAQSRRCLTFALTRDAASLADVYVTDLAWRGRAWDVSATTPWGPLNFSLSVAGRHNVKNALAAACCALAAGVDLDAVALGLRRFEAVNGRSRALLRRTGSAELTVIDDSYNANPDSVRAAIDILTTLPAPRTLVLGDMGEVGDQGPAFHAEVGAYARQQGIAHLFTLGALCRHSAQAFEHGQHFDDIDALNQHLLQHLGQGGSVVIKGSRFMRMERALQAVLSATTDAVGAQEAACS